MQQTHLFPMVRHELGDLLNGYIQAPDIVEHLDTYVVPPGLGGRAGIAGAMALAEAALSPT